MPILFLEKTKLSDICEQGGHHQNNSVTVRRIQPWPLAPTSLHTSLTPNISKVDTASQV